MAKKVRIYKCPVCGYNGNQPKTPPERLLASLQGRVEERRTYYQRVGGNAAIIARNEAEAMLNTVKRFLPEIVEWARTGGAYPMVASVDQQIHGEEDEGEHDAS